MPDRSVLGVWGIATPKLLVLLVTKEHKPHASVEIWLTFLKVKYLINTYKALLLPLREKGYLLGEDIRRPQ